MSAPALKVELFDMVLCLSRALDLFHPELTDHHLLVGNIGASLAAALDLPDDLQADILVAGALHDVGSVSVASRLALLDFSLASYNRNAGSAKAAYGVHRHACDGWRLLRDFPPFARAAEIIRFHHVPWAYGAGADFHGNSVPLASHILHLADRIAVLPTAGQPILQQRERILSSIRGAGEAVFHPELLAAFDSLAERQSFWFDLVYPHQEKLARSHASGRCLSLKPREVQEIARVFGRIIDFRSPFTANHSSGVAACAARLASLAGMGEEEVELMSVAGHLHDLGKLAVPPDILNKPGPLTPDERSLMCSHAYHTYRILETLPGFETINIWASFHHEQPGGGGYPFCPGALPLGSRLMAVADIFTALSEDRPYRAGMGAQSVRKVLHRAVDDGALDGDVVGLALRNFDELSAVRLLSQATGEPRPVEACMVLRACAC